MKKKKRLLVIKDRLQLIQTLAEAYNNLGVICDAQGNFEQAIHNFEISMIFNPKIPGPRIGLECGPAKVRAI